MKKTLLATAVLLALGAPMAVFAAADELDAGTYEYADVIGGGADASGVNASASEGLRNVGNIGHSGSHNLTLDNAFNDVNSDNSTTIAEDGIVAHANELNQAIASADSKLTVSGNEVVMEGAINDTSALSPIAVTVTNVGRTELNSMAGSFSNYGGIATAGQNIGSTTAVAQSVVIQSNGGI